MRSKLETQQSLATDDEGDIRRVDYFKTEENLRIHLKYGCRLSRELDTEFAH